MITAAPRITINGVTIVNFSSPHAFHFEDGSILEACDETRCRHLSAVANEVESRPEGQAWTDIELSFELGNECRDELAALDSDLSIDIVLAPLPIVQAARAADVGRKARTVRMADRVKKLAHTDKFCV